MGKFLKINLFNKFKITKEAIFLFLILLLGAFFRLYGLNWDQGFHLHPDERAIVMFSLPLKLPPSLSEFLSVSSQWNPHFFAYGSFPLYLLNLAANLLENINPFLSSYDGSTLVGRFLSASFDISTLFLVYILGKKLFSKSVGLLGAFFYAISVLPIQLSHFYAVDSILTFFIISTLYLLVRFYEKPTFVNSLLVGLFFGLSLATKTSALVLIVSIGAALISDFVLIFMKNPHRPHIWFPHVPRLLKTLFADGLIIIVTTFTAFFIFEPYAFLDFKEFWAQTLEQSRMTHDAFTFPYTLQYVGKIPYFYELKNIFLWGQGPILATISFLGIFYVASLVIKKQKERKWAQEFILLIFLLSYFAVVGKFAVGWMRYMLLLYPLLCLFGAVFTYKIIQILNSNIKSGFILNTLYLILYTSLLLWPFSFMQIYTKPNTRVLASDWINRNIPIGSIIATEHWDDGLPLGTQGDYKVLVLPIYNMENPASKTHIYQSVQKSDYIVLASNRLYTPLQRIANNCKNWDVPPERCPQNANFYYEQLFNGSLGFREIAKFENAPIIPILNIPINDQSADESFTVYDHPIVRIFQKLP